MTGDGPELLGIVTVLNTPFTDDDRVDLDALARHAEVAVGAGVAGFLVPAKAAEVDVLTTTERHDIVRTVVEAARGHVPVIGGASADTHPDRCRHAEAMARLGCGAVLVSQPFETTAQYRDELAEVAAAAGLPLMAQDWDAQGAGVPVPAIADAFHQVPAFRYLKVETANAGPKYTAVKAATAGRLHVSGGWAAMQLIEALDREVDAFMPTALHRTYTTIHRRYTAGDRSGATDLFRKILPVLAFSNQHLEFSIHFFKRLLWRQGLYPTPKLRAPRHPFDTVHQRIADELIELALDLEDDLRDAR